MSSFTETGRCLSQAKTSPRAQLSCSKVGGVESCFLSCPAHTLFVPGLQGKALQKRNGTSSSLGPSCSGSPSACPCCMQLGDLDFASSMLAGRKGHCSGKTFLLLALPSVAWGTGDEAGPGPRSQQAAGRAPAQGKEMGQERVPHPRRVFGAQGLRPGPTLSSRWTCPLAAPFPCHRLACRRGHHLGEFWLSPDAPTTPIKQKARFKIRDAKCHLQPHRQARAKETTRQPLLDHCHVTFVTLKCDSSKKRRRGRKSPSKELSHITAEFEIETRMEEASGLKEDDRLQVLVGPARHERLPPEHSCGLDGSPASGESTEPTGKGSWQGSAPAAQDTCEADCLRKRAEQSLQAAIKTLRKTIGRQHFYVQVSGTEYEVAQRPAKALEGQGTCSAGQVPPVYSGDLTQDPVSCRNLSFKA
ncbi:hypothetical protein P7K49_002342 [Saguinus oedipus]|uniref:Uncharacterized protein n=1 Tax=Saguinus oedipus TaxID=9490 RepID=A0ABQ9WH42_SAGOE|nr:hypothetical protein P7K49_002342 [Saguinus oedipus]